MTITGVDVVGFIAACTLAATHQDAEPLVLKVHSTHAAGATLVLSVAVNSWVWALYSGMENDTFPVTMYGFIVLLDAWEVFKFYRSTVANSYVAKLGGAAALLLLLWTVFFPIALHDYDEHTHTLLRQALGVAGGLTTAVYLWYLLKTAVLACKQHSSEPIPITATSFAVVNAGMWVFYSSLVADWFLFAPTTAVLLVGLAQVVLYFALPATSSRGVWAWLGSAANESEDLETGATKSYGTTA